MSQFQVTSNPVTLSAEQQAAVDRLRASMPQAAQPMTPEQRRAALKSQLDDTEQKLADAHAKILAVNQITDRANELTAEREKLKARDAAIGVELEGLAHRVRDVRKHVPQEASVNTWIKLRGQLLEQLAELEPPATSPALPSSDNNP